MEFTGERFHPELVREIWYEHYHRYAFALPLVRSKRVLDLACGEGYGSALLARQAAEIVGVDLSEEAVSHARERYRFGNLRFEQGDATAIPLESASVDVVVSFETVEHLMAQEQMIDEFDRVLARGGLLVISSPDRRTYSDERGYENEHHVRELYRDEFEALLARRFSASRLLGQKLAFVSHIWDAERADGPVQRVGLQREASSPVEWPLAPMYWIALAARDESVLREIPVSDSLFVDPEESVYGHYYHEIRKNMSAGQIILDRDARIAELEAEIRALRARSAPDNDDS